MNCMGSEVENSSREGREEFKVLHASLWKISCSGHRKMWRQRRRRRRILTLRRSFHLDLFTATSDTLSHAPKLSLDPFPGFL